MSRCGPALSWSRGNGGKSCRSRRGVVRSKWPMLHDRDAQFLDLVPGNVKLFWLIVVLTTGHRESMGREESATIAARRTSGKTPCSVAMATLASRQALSAVGRLRRCPGGMTTSAPRTRWVRGGGDEGSESGEYRGVPGGDGAAGFWAGNGRCPTLSC